MTQLIPLNKKRHSTFSVLFFVNKTKIKKNGLCTIICRISINSESVLFSTKLDASPACWNPKTGKATGSSRSSADVNAALEQLTLKISRFYEDFMDKQGYATAELVKNALNGAGQKQDMLLKLFAEHNEEFKSRVGVNRAKNTYYIYTLSFRHLAAFIRHKYGEDDMSLKRLNLSFIDTYDFYLRVEKKLAQNSIAIHIIILKKIVRRAIRQGTLKCDPFFAYTLEQSEKKCRHLKIEEIERIMQIHLVSPYIRHTRDMFIFSCFTGLAYRDLRNLSVKNLKTGSDGSLWLWFKRQKTNTGCQVRLLEIPRLIIEKYSKERKNDRLFNMACFSCTSVNLKKLGELCGIGHITFHMARHNFGTHITLSQGVPIETVSKMMGHSSISTTQIYAKITNQKVNEDMKRLSERIAGRYTIFEDASMPVSAGYKRR
jgi:site-specific recombinase XerD